MADIHQLSDLEAWRSDYAYGPSSLHVIGAVVAPSPWHAPFLTYVGDLKPDPPIYLLRLDYTVGPGPKIYRPTIKSFNYDQQNYAGTHAQAAITTPDGQVTTINIRVIS
jgi:hypothetical protein